MIKYSKELEEQGLFLCRDMKIAFFWDTPENLSKYPWGTKDGWEKEETNPGFRRKIWYMFLIYPL